MFLKIIKKKSVIFINMCERHQVGLLVAAAESALPVLASRHLVQMEINIQDSYTALRLDRPTDLNIASRFPFGLDDETRAQEARSL
jgi:hypothetical protein